MRSLIVMLGAVAMLVGVATQPASAGKGTEIERFIKRIQKFAVDDVLSPKPKGLCVCQDGQYLARVGALAYDGQLGDTFVSVVCQTRRFHPDGELQGVTSCATFEVLSK